MRKLVGLAIVAVTALIQVRMSAGEPPSASYQQNMQSAAGALGLSGYAAPGTTPRSDVETARALQASFAAMEPYWTEKRVAAAVDLARSGRAAAVEFETAAASNDKEAVAAARKRVTGACLACHRAYVTRLPDGAFDIKIPPITPPGTGSGRGAGIGLAPGIGPGTGGGVYRPGSGVTDPAPTVRANPQYTANAMLMRAEGEVWMQCVVRVTGECSDIRVVRSVDPVFGLDEAAAKAVQQWRFTPGTRQGEPVSVQVTITLEFLLR